MKKHIQWEEPHYNAESSICSNNGKGEQRKARGRGERERVACCLDCSESRKGGGEGGESSFW